ncbi:hypothetical protein [Paenibacillus silvisoli]|uniref:hypothetical protein n=1 Tax=Paenibacillus silvisoli TaxID=3110539 RepID=UPI002804F2DC|nr:hypothetical protein [Paenibacillus silvisoli]
MKNKPMPNDEQQDLHVSEDDIDRALSRLFDAVKEEQVPAAWLQQKPAQHETGIAKPAQHVQAEPSPQPQLHTQSWEQPSTPQRKAPRRLMKRWMTAATAAVIAGTMMFSSWGQDVMAAVMNTFRVQHFETIQISRSDIESFRNALQQGASGTQQLDLNKYGEIEQQGGGQARSIKWEEAKTLAASSQLKQLTGDGELTMKYMPDQQITFKLHPKEINKMIAFLGGKTEFPASVENSPIVLTLPGTYMTKLESEDGRLTKQLIQLPAPSLDVADEVDVEGIRQAVLDLPIIPEEMRTKLAGIGDWRNTLPIPSTSTENVRTTKIDGNEAIVTSSGFSRSVIWLQNDWVYQLSGSAQAYPSDEAIIDEAKGLMK